MVDVGQVPRILAVTDLAQIGSVSPSTMVRPSLKTVSETGCPVGDRS